MLHRVKNRAVGGNLMEMPSAWDTYQGISNVKQQAQDMERRAVSDKTAPENVGDYLRFGTTGLSMEYKKRKDAATITPKLDELGKKMNPKGQKLLPAPQPERDLYGKELTDPAKLTTRKSKMPLGAKLGTLGKGALMTYGYGLGKVAQGFRDRTEEYNAREADEPMSEPAPKKDATTRISSTSSVADTKSTPPQGKLKPAGKGVHKGGKPQTTEGPKKAKKDPGVAQQEKAAATGAKQAAEQTQTPEQQEEQALQGRASEFRQRLSAISMVKGATPAAPQAPKNKAPQAAKESVAGFLHGILALREAGVVKWPKSERAVAKFLKSKANTGIRKGTPVKHTFRSNDGLHQYSGRELAMRQKIMSEHRRKGFDLDPNFPNMAPKDIGAHFDQLSDRGMLEDRPKLDDSYLGNFRRKVTRVGGRLGRKVKSFFSSLTGPAKQHEKAKEAEAATTAPLIESTTPFCNFSVGNVKYPGECGCAECCTLIETAGSTFGQNMRADVQEVGNIHEDVQKKKAVIKRLLSKRKSKKRKMREAHEDVNRTVIKDWELHRRSPAPLSVTRRPNTYFQTGAALRKLDRLGMFLAKTAIVANGLAPMAQSLMWQYKDSSPKFWADTRRAAASIHASIVGKSRVFKGVPVREARSFEDELGSAGRTYDRVAPKVREFVDSPWQSVKNASHALGMRGVKKLGKVTGSKFLKKHAYPLGKVAGYGGLLAGAYGAKKVLYDPIKKRVQKSRLAKVNKFKGEMEDYGNQHLTF